MIQRNYQAVLFIINEVIENLSFPSKLFTFTFYFLTKKRGLSTSLLYIVNCYPLGLNIIAARNPKTIAAETPGLTAFNIPVNIPIKPIC